MTFPNANDRLTDSLTAKKSKYLSLSTIDQGFNMVTQELRTFEVLSAFPYFRYISKTELSRLRNGYLKRLTFLTPFFPFTILVSQLQVLTSSDFLLMNPERKPYNMITYYR